MKLFVRRGSALLATLACAFAVATASGSVNAALGPATAADMVAAITLVLQRADAVQLIREIGPSLHWNANPDIAWRRENNDDVYCPHQVYVFATTVDLLHSWRWIINVRSREVLGPVKVDASTLGDLHTIIDTKKCLDGTSPQPLPE